ncbi:MAG: glycosyltransferase family 2 protein [Patescibacteria group bacterium]|nr:glycosyltransferase family 2 protein [Patescibacteria group bacterium]
MDVSIIVVSWRVKQELHECLQSIFSYSKYFRFEVFVVDNNSQDGTAEMMRSEFKQVHFIENDHNCGFAYACNQAIKLCTGQYILLLNPDVAIQDDAIGECLRFIQAHPEIGIVGCRIANKDKTTQPSVRKFPDFVSHFLILLKVHNLFPQNRAIQKYYCKNFNYNAIQQVDQVMGAFFLFTRVLIKKIGLLDEHFFIWYEEVDYCRRALRAGYKTYYFPNATVQHGRAKSFSQANAFEKQLWFSRSLLYYFYKHQPRYQYFILLLFYPLSLFLALIVSCLKLKKRNADF